MNHPKRLSKLYLSILLTITALSMAITFQNCAGMNPEMNSTASTSNSTSIMKATLLSPKNTLKWVFVDGGHTTSGHPDYYNFQTFYHFMNVFNQTITVVGEFQGDMGRYTKYFQLPPNSQTTKSLAELLPNSGATGFTSAVFYSDIVGTEIFVDQATYNKSFDGIDWESAKAVPGTAEARSRWVFGEAGAFAYPRYNGVLNPNFAPIWDHWYAVYNPNSIPITLYADFHGDRGDSQTYNGATFPFRLTYMVQANSRLAFNPADNPLFYQSIGGSMSAVLQSTLPFVAQMTMYQRRNVSGRSPNTQAALGSQSARKWFVPGVPTLGNDEGIAGYQNRFYIFNDSFKDNLVTFKWYGPSGGSPLHTTSFLAPPRRRFNYDGSQNSVAGQPASLTRPPQGKTGGELTLKITAQHPIALTKIYYWGRRFTWAEGASTTGFSKGGSGVMFPGANFVPGAFWNWIQVMNTGGTDAYVSYKIYRPNGVNPPGSFTPISPNNRIPSNGVLEIDASTLNVNGDFALYLKSEGAPIVAEMITGFQWQSGDLMWRSGTSVEGIVVDNNLKPVRPDLERLELSQAQTALYSQVCFAVGGAGERFIITTDQQSSCTEACMTQSCGAPAYCLKGWTVFSNDATYEYGNECSATDPSGGQNPKGKICCCTGIGCASSVVR